MDLSSASDQPSGVRRRLSSRKAAQLRSLFCSGTPTARLETESDDAVLLHRKISRSEGRIAAAHPPAPRRERKKSVIIIPLPAACIVSSSIIFLLLFLLFLALVSEASEFPELAPTTPGQYSREIYRFHQEWKFDAIFSKSRPSYHENLNVGKVSLFEGYGKNASQKPKDFENLIAAAGIEKDTLDELVDRAAQKAKSDPEHIQRLGEKEIKKISKHVYWVSALAHSKEKKDFEGLDVGTAILVLWESPKPDFNSHHLGVVFVSGRPKGWRNLLKKGERKETARVSAYNALSLIIHYNLQYSGEKERSGISVFATHPIFEMPYQTMDGCNKALNSITVKGAPIIDFVDKDMRFSKKLKAAHASFDATYIHSGPRKDLKEEPGEKERLEEQYFRKGHAFGNGHDVEDMESLTKQLNVLMRRGNNPS